MTPGDAFYVSDGSISIPEGGYICMWALQSILPLITPKERRIAEDDDQDWLWRVHHAQCPDPEGRVVFRIDRMGSLDREQKREAAVTPPQAPCPTADELRVEQQGPKDLRVVVSEVRGRCTAGMQPGDYFTLRSGRLYIPAGHHFCLYALHASLPLLPAKQRPLPDGDWLKEDSEVICPDPAGNVVMRIEHAPLRT
jgi:uncharacterized repeat protein (TIGR04076 family)